jgi:TatA/E family protein of Tat protein translocase
MLNIGPQELILVLIIALIVVGPSRLPELGRSIGKALREFRKVQDEVKDTFRFDLNDEPPTRATSTTPRPHTTRTGSPNGEAVAPTGPPDAEPAAPEPSATEPVAADTPTDGPAPEPSA